MRGILSAMLAVGFSGALHAAPAAVDPAQALLEQARLWQSLGRPLEAQQALDKLQRIHAATAQDRAEALTLQALVQVQQRQDKDAQQTLAKLRKLYPGYSGIARVEQMRRIMGPDRNKLLTARSLFNSGKIEQAYAAFNALYQGPPPEGALALEYWQLVARLPNGGWARSQAELKKLIRQSPSNHRNRLALASIYLLHPPVPASVLADLKALTQFSDSRSEALGLWRRALQQSDLPDDAYLAYLKVEPEDELVSSRLASLQDGRRKRREQLADPAYRALLAADKQLDANQLAAAEKSLQLAASRYGKQAGYLQSLGRLREKQGRYADAVASYRQGQSQQPDDKGWKRRIADAQLADLLARAQAAMQAGQWQAARAQLDQAGKQQPGNVDVLLADAEWQAGQKHAVRARQLYRQALQSKLDSGQALAGLLRTYLDAGEYAQAAEMLRALPPKQQRALGTSYQSARADVERELGDRLLAQGQLSQALPHLQKAVDLQPQNTWNRYALANAWLAAGDAAKGGAILRQLADAPAASPESLYAYALFQAKREDDRSALGALQRIAPDARSEGMAALQRRVWLRETMRQADAQLAFGHAAEARRSLQNAERLMRGDPARLSELAQAWLRAGDAEHARQMLLTQYLEQPGADNELAYADLLLDLGDAAAAAPLLAASAQTRQDMNDEQKRKLADLQAALASAQADAARDAGDGARAQAILLQAAAAAPQDARLQRKLADYDMDAGRWGSARARLRQVLSQQPDDDEAQLQLVDLYIKTGQRDLAVHGVDALLRDKPGRSLDFRLRALTRLGDAGETERLDREIAALLAQGVKSPALMGQAARRARQQDRPAQALAWYRAGFAPAGNEVQTTANSGLLLGQQPLRPVPAESAQQEGLHEDYAELLDARSVKIWQGLDLTYRSADNGTPGQSQMTMWQAPLLVELPAPRAGKYFLRADAVSINAGSLDNSLGNDYALQRFGSVAACAAQSGSSVQSCAGQYGAQTAQGAALGLGYENEHWRVDAGVTPQSFPVSNLIGGVRYSDSVSILNYKLEAVRRPVTSSLLSYAGVRDPYTGQTWGGVVATGVGGSLGYDKGGRFGVWSNFAYQQLTGENVADNRKLTAMGGVYWRLLKEPTRQVTVGVNSINFWFQKNLGEFTFGQGGYYSPQRYNSLSVPLSYAARNERWSWLGRASVSVSSANEAASPFYPTRPDLQAQAGNPYVSASSGPGWGVSLSGAFEYQLTARLALGGMLEYQHSQYYQPGRALFYLRYQPDGASLTLPFPVEPLQPYSSF
ncbi:cellulose synthase subunit BcsC-related outer membrane protein [Chromobacterium subtsugae]|uniref:cellulose synthase subunit BcsC-related outer membrane protein n=1 Tax=Chromobacterium subtsugae TaxID=251747 RepID=UPI0006410950|nr:cellulose synthase subunit BcsC-related outer membrane protein [Chromobacterium subtsugae]